MKKITLLVASVCVGVNTVAGAFNLDVVGYDGTEVNPSPLAIFLPGYGEVVFEAADASVLVVNSAYQNNNPLAGSSLIFDATEMVKMKVKGDGPLNVDCKFGEVPTEEVFAVEKDLLTPQLLMPTFKTTGEGAGPLTVSWEIQRIPEPSLALLGMIAGGFLVFRRRR